LYGRYGPILIKDVGVLDGILKFYNLYKYINIVDGYKIKRPEWSRLIIRMKDEKNPKKGS